jgi:hypothetical protein
MSREWDPNRQPSKRKELPLRTVNGKKEDVYKFLWAYKYNQALQSIPFDLIKIIARLLYYERNLVTGDLVDVLDTVLKWYPCVITDCRADSIYIHYCGWSHNFDEWILLTSRRLDSIFTHETHYGNIQQSHLKENCVWCRQICIQFVGKDIQQLVLIQTP